MEDLTRKQIIEVARDYRDLYRPMAESENSENF